MEKGRIRRDRKCLLFVLCETFAVCRLGKDESRPHWAMVGSFLSVTRTKEELSIVCPEENVPDGVLCEKGWRCLKIKGPIDLSLTGIVASITQVLGGVGLSVFVVSTYDTDYFLVKEQHVKAAISELRKEGYEVRLEKDTDILP